MYWCYKWIDTSGIFGSPVSVFPSADLFSFNSQIEFSVNGSLTFEMEVLFLDPECGAELNPLEVTSLIELKFIPFFINQSSNLSNDITNPLPVGELCGFVDLCIETVQINPIPSQVVNWSEEVTLETTICNNGPEDAFMRFFLLNLGIPWNITSITCDGTTGSVSCTDFTIINQGQFWESSEFVLNAGTTITITTLLNYTLPEDACSTVEQNIISPISSQVNLLDNLLIDTNTDNDFDFDNVVLPSLPLCDDGSGGGGNTTQLSISKTQIDPILPIGSDPNNTTEWGEITYQHKHWVL